MFHTFTYRGFGSGSLLLLLRSVQLFLPHTLDAAGQRYSVQRHRWERLQLLRRRNAWYVLTQIKLTYSEAFRRQYPWRSNLPSGSTVSPKSSLSCSTRTPETKHATSVYRPLSQLHLQSTKHHPAGEDFWEENKCTFFKHLCVVWFCTEKVWWIIRRSGRRQVSYQ